MAFTGRQPIVERIKYQVSSTHPSNAVVGDVYLNDGNGSLEHGLYAYNGITFQKINARKENWLMNGWFGVNTRGSSFNVSSVRKYLDRWISSSVIGGTAVISQSTLALGSSNDRFSLTLTQGDTTVHVFQLIEDIRTTVGIPYTVSFEAFSDGATVGQTFLVEQFFGTGGSPSGTVTVLSEAYSITSTRTKFSFTFTPPSISGKTLGTNNDHGLRVYLTSSSGTGSSVLQWTKAMMNEGFETSEFIPFGGSEQLDRLACLRYARKSYSDGVNPGTATSAGIHEWECNGFTSGSYTFRRNLHWGENMRGTPSITVYDSAGTAGNANVASGSVAATVDQVSSTGFRVSAADGVSGTTRRLAYHFLADSEF